MTGLEHIIINLKNIGVFIIFLSILILVHEWGHFIIAKRLGVDVVEFAIGFGPTLFSRIFQKTKYMIKLFPLGGFVRMAGDERLTSQGLPGEYYSQSVGRRALIVLSGPFINFVLAYACFVFVFLLGYPDFSTKIVGLRYGYPAHRAGLVLGDQIIRVNSKKISGWSELKNSIAESKRDQIELVFLRDGQQITKEIVPRMEFERDLFGQYQRVRSIGIDEYSNRIGYLQDGYPAQKADFQVGDRIIKIDDKEIYGWKDLQSSIAESTNDQLHLVILRDDQNIVKTVSPRIEMKKNKFGQNEKIRLIGIGLHEEEMDYFKFGLVSSIKKGFQKFKEVAVLTSKAVYFMATGKISAKDNIAGPIGIFSIVSEFSNKGFVHFLLILGVISSNLAIFNLLPIIPLDGGHLFLQAIEKIRGRALPQKVDEAFARIGLSLIILLALFVFYIDSERIGLIEKIKELFL